MRRPENTFPLKKAARDRINLILPIQLDPDTKRMILHPEEISIVTGETPSRSFCFSDRYSTNAEEFQLITNDDLNKLEEKIRTIRKVLASIERIIDNAPLPPNLTTPHG